MRVLFRPLLILVPLFCLPLLGAALNVPRAAVDLEGNNDVAGGSNGVAVTTTNPPRWRLIPSYVAGGLQYAFRPPALRLTDAFQTLVVPSSSPSPSPSDFWEMAAKYEQVLQDYVSRLLRKAAGDFKSTAFTDIPLAMDKITDATATFRESIQGALDAHNTTLDALTGELEAIFVKIVNDLEDVPSPDKAPRHAERIELVDGVLGDTERALTDLAARYGVGETVVATYLHALRPQVLALVVIVGDINEQHPQLLHILLFSVAAMLIPESWILRPFLSVFGFGPQGPVKGSAAAWMQKRFWGAAVEAGSWFALLQAAGMGKLPSWAGTVATATSAPLIVGLLVMFLLCCCCCRG